MFIKRINIKRRQLSHDDKIGDKVVESLSSNWVTLENKTIHTLPLPYIQISGLQITAGQRTMSGLITDLTGQTPVLPVILTGHFWIQTLYFPYSCPLMLYNAAMISFFFGFFFCFALNPSKEKNAAIN